MSLTLLTTLAVAGQVFGLSIDTKLDLPNPSLAQGDRNFYLDSSLSPKIIKAFYEINFVPVSSPDDFSKNGLVTLSDKRNCLYSREVCKYLYFVPSKISTVQKVEEMIQNHKENEVPVIQGLTSKTEVENFMREVNDTVSNQVNKVVHVSGGNSKKDNDTDIPVYQGTIQTQEVLNKPEHSNFATHQPLLPRPYYPPTNRPQYHWTDYGGWRNHNLCLQGPCHWRLPFSTSIFNPTL